ncbi:MAG: Terminase-like family protein [Herbinix sp.]|jgi:PBSX family phage terminase large subunit|nr:Terminase-like family protein [Herbinix sp.]
MIWSEKQSTYITQPFEHTLEVNEGTPRSAKTTAIVFRYALYLLQSDDQNHLVVAYNQEQAYKLVMECDGFGLIHIFDGNCRMRHDDNGDHLEITTPKGIRRVYYKGGGKADSHKGITGLSLGSVYFCEINLIHMNMIQECFRRTFAAKKRWHVADLNPPAPFDPVIKEVFEVQDTSWLHWTINDNPIITPERKEEIRKTLLKSPYLYARDWEGKRVIPAGVIYAMFDPARHIKAKLIDDKNNQTMVELFFSADGGQGDATSCACNIIIYDKMIKKYIMYRVAHYYHSGTETGQVKAMSTYAVEIKSFINWCEKKFRMHRSSVYVDPACKSLREELHKIGIVTDKANNNGKEKVGASKGIEVGLERAQNAINDGLFYLVETDTYSHYDFLKEIGMYCRDANGKPIDAYNHAMDEFRYSINHFYTDYIN